MRAATLGLLAAVTLVACSDLRTVEPGGRDAGGRDSREIADAQGMSPDRFDAGDVRDRDGGDAGDAAGEGPDVPAALDASADGGELDPAPADSGPGPEDGGAADAMSSADAGPKRIVILMIGDGMGKEQVAAASLFSSGARGRLFMESLPHRGEIITGSLSGITDSAAAATTMATGYKTFNGSIGLDRGGQSQETLVELAHRLGLSAGIVSTAAITHATPAGFSAHRNSRHDALDIAVDQAMTVRPEVMLGGGFRHYLPTSQGGDRSDDGLVDDLTAAGWRYATNATELAAASPAPAAKVLGLFAHEHMDYAADRAQSSTQPTLTEMSLAALRLLDTHPAGFFLMIEGARIDMASHGNDLRNTVHDTIAFDEAVRAVAGWATAGGRTDASVVVTADHECGGLRVSRSNGAGQLPEVSWRWGQHTNARVPIFALGPGTEMFDGAARDHAEIHAFARARLAGDVYAPPAAVLAPDGHLADLRHRASAQAVVSGFGAGYNQLDTLLVDADSNGLALGIQGLFQWGRNAVVVLIDHDLGAGTGLADVGPGVSDRNARVDAILSSLTVSSPNIPGFGADFALVVWGGTDPRIEDLLADAGLRGLRAPFGDRQNLGWFAAAVNFGEQVRTSTAALMPTSGEGLEAFIPWTVLYPDLSGSVPAGAVVGVAAFLVNDDGGFASNQALPPFAPGTANPGRGGVPLPGIVRFVVDSNSDGTGDGDSAPSVVPRN